MLSQQLQQKLQQKLSPQQIQLVKLLEVPNIELEERIQRELEENPALEEGVDESLEQNNTDIESDPNEDKSIDDDLDFEEYMQQDDIPEYKLRTNNVSRDDKHEDIPFSIGISFHEHLLEQLSLQNLKPEEREIAEYILGNIDDEGYLRREPESMADDIAFQLGKEVSDELIYRMIKVVRSLDPAGVGAYTLQECLSLQLQRKEATKAICVAQQIIDECFESFSKKHYEKIIKRYNLTENELKAAIGEIVRLNPKPGNAWGGLLEQNNGIIIPDFILEIEQGNLVVLLNNGEIPNLRVSNTYKEMFETYSNDKTNNKELKETVQFVKQKLDAAKWFIDALKQRNQTLISTMETIVDFQREFFLKGDETLLKPMILKDIAERTGLDISTISRVSNSKYIQTDFGVFPVKYFFSESMQTTDGEEVSSKEIKKILTDVIAVEDKKKPVTDEKLMEILNEKGYKIARRTVAKYREQLNIPVARLRKEI